LAAGRSSGAGASAPGCYPDEQDLTDKQIAEEEVGGVAVAVPTRIRRRTVLGGLINE